MAMEPPLNLNPVKERRVKRAAGLRCELCGGTYPSDLLEIHLLPGNGRRVNPGPDLQREILVLCHRCHREIHESRVSRADQKTLVRSRTAGVRKEIRAILGYHPKPYTPPEADLAAVYEEAHQLSSLFRVV
jgi:hypothetical protein